MNSTFSNDILTLITDSTSIIYIAGDNIFISHSPELPNDCITIYDTGGENPDNEINPINNFIEHPSCQIRVRNENYETAYQIMMDIIHILKIAPNDINGSCYGSIIQIGGIISLGKDDKERYVLVCNFRGLREEI